MAAVFPEAGSDQSASIAGIALETHKLEIGESFEDKAHQPNGSPDCVEYTERRVPLRENTGHRKQDNHGEKPLQQEHLKVGSYRHVASPFFAPLTIARVFRFSPVPNADMKGQAHSPNDYEREQQHSAA